MSGETHPPCEAPPYHREFRTTAWRAAYNPDVRIDELPRIDATSRRYRRDPFAVDPSAVSPAWALTDSFGSVYVITPDGLDEGFLHPLLVAPSLDDLGFGAVDGSEASHWASEYSIALAEGPRHRQLRSALANALSPKNLAELVPMFRRTADLVVTNACPAGVVAFDGIADIAQPYPRLVFREMLGVADDAWWSSIETHVSGAIVASHDTATRRVRGGSVDDFVRHFAALSTIVTELVGAAKPGWLTTKLKEEVSAGRISDDQARGMHIQLLMSGWEPTIAQIGACLEAMCCAQDGWGRYRQAPRRALAEALRYRPVAIGAFRVASQDFTWRTLEIPSGTRVALASNFATRDPETFDCPHSFDPAANDEKHWAFGGGRHLCTGRTLAMAQLDCIFEALAARCETLTGPERTAVRWTSIHEPRRPLELALSTHP